MKKLISLILIFSSILLLCCITPSYAQTISRTGNTYTTTQDSANIGSIKTNYTWVENNQHYTIFITKKSGKCYIVKTSKTTHKPYRKYLPEYICIEICNELNIEYKP